MNNLKKKRLAIGIAVVFLISFTTSVTACNDDGIIDLGEHIGKENIIFTLPFYVFSANRREDIFRDECGYLLFEDHGGPGLFHGSFVWTENLPEEYQLDLLPVIVTFRYTGEICGSYRVIEIIKIQKQ